MIIFLTLLQIIYPNVIYNFDANLNIPNEWSSVLEPYYISCDQIQYFGIEDQLSVINRFFLNLEPHSAIKVEAYFLKFDYNDDVVQFFLDDKSVEYQEIKNQSQTQSCGGISLSSISIIHQHNRRSAWVNIKQPPGGIISLQISIVKCQEECIACISNYPFSCVNWNLHEFAFNQKQVGMADGWTLTPNYIDIKTSVCGGCEYLKTKEISYSTQLPPHQDILIRFYKGSQNSIFFDYMYENLMIQQDVYFVEILIKNYPNEILNLNIKATVSIQEIWVRDFEIYYTLPEIKYLSLYEGCQEQFGGQCLNCLEGWTLDEYQQNCSPICGDMIIQGYEECDDGNLISNDGCFQCKHSCIESCKVCMFGICKECLNGFLLNENNNCDPECGDGIVIPYSTEQCDINVDEDQSGCQHCRYIPIPYCKQSYFSKCFECQDGFSTIDFVCEPYCGDKIVIEQLEDCDDGNQQPNDGCYQCKFQCIEGCNICDQGQCRLKCEIGYEFTNNNCYSVCGDQIVTKEEECEDGNTIIFDGCFECKYSCPQNCHDCYQGICLESINQTQVQNSNQFIQQVDCGDGFMQEQEECDDGNEQPSDGCINCLIEQNWICNSIASISPSQCNFVKAPNIVIYYLNMTQNKQYLSIQFNQQVKVYTSQLLSKTISLKLANIESEYWNSSLYIIQDVGSYVTSGEYILEIEVFKLIDFKPTLNISLNQQVANIDNAILVDYSKSITLDFPKYLDELQMNYSFRLKNTNIYLMYILAAITAVSLLVGSGDLFVEILAILQYQQYLRYINLKFPQNLEIYFSINDMISIEPLLNFIHFQYIFKFINIQTDQEYSEGKIIKYNSNLIINLSSQIFQCVICLLLMLIFKWIKKIIYNWIFCSRYFECMSSLSKFINPTIILKFSQLFYDNCLSMIELEKLISFQGLQKALLLNGWDMIFKILLYTRNIQTNNYLDIIQIILASIILLLYFIIILNKFEGRTQNLQIYQQKNFEMLNFSRQFIFLLFLVYVQGSSILQLGLLLLTNIFEINLIFNYRCILTKSTYIVQMVVEISVFIYMLSSFLYIEEFNQYFNEAQKILLGWIQAILLSSGIVIELVMILYKYGKIFKQKCLNMQQNEKLSKMKSPVYEQKIEHNKRIIFQF